MFSALLKDTSRVVSDEPADELTQADCPRVSDIFTAVLVLPASSQFRVEEFPATSEVFVTIMNTDVIMGSNSIPENIISSFTVHPVPAPPSISEPVNNKIREGGSSQKLILFKRGNAISGAPIITGTI